MAAYELGGGVYHNVGAVFYGTEQIRRCKSVVHNQGDAGSVGHFCHLFYIGDIGVGIAQSLYENSLCLFFDGPGKVFNVAAVYKCRGDSVGHQGVLQQIVGAAVYVFGGDDMISRARDVQYGIGDGGGAGSHGKCAYTALKSGDTLLKDILGGICQAAVDIAGVGQAKAGGGVLAIVEHIGCGLIYRHRARVACGVRLFLSYVDL